MVLSSVLMLVLLQYATAQDCSGNIVQALQQCASAITGNQPLSVLQEKCSPDGCNYDCPSSDALKSLEAKYTNVSQVLQQVLTTQQAQSVAIANNTNRISALSFKVDELHDYCGSTGWTKIAGLDMSDPSQNCPPELRLYSQSNLRACGRQITGGASCDSITYSVEGNSYTQVCGRVIGYQFGSADAFDFLRRPPQYTGLETPYVDGVSITHGSPRQHIWTFVASINSNGQEDTQNYCPCDGSGRISAPDFVGEDYFCESGNPAETGWASILYTDDQIWDGKNCGSGETQCCSAPDIPWFHKVLDSPSTNNIELRVCGEEGTYNEDTPLSLIELYVK